MDSIRWSGLVDREVPLLAASVEARAAQASTAIANVANAETPGFRPREVDFTALLEARLRGLAEPPTVERDDREPGLDGNSVSVPRQMADLAASSTAHEAAIRLLGRRLEATRLAVTDGRR